MRSIRIAFLLCLTLCATVCSAFPITFTGYLDDPANTALVGSDLGAPSFVDDWATANNVALLTFSVAAPATVSVDSNGFAAGGVDPYFTLFFGTGASASLITSNYDQAFTTGGDFLIARILGTGDYTIALGAFANMSMAENNPDADPTLGDGFTWLGGPSFIGNGYYELVLDAETTPRPTPEPGALALVVGALLLVARARGTRTRPRVR